MRWSPQQDDALKAVSAWLARPRAQVFRLFGYAGTGKTTLARHLAEDIDGDVAFGAFTGKAALVMRSKGCDGASTIHAMIYRPRGGDEDGPSFALNRSGAAAEADLIVIDECSMVDEELGRDLLSFGKKVLVLGDPAQLPPVKGGGFFTDAEPDAMLTEVHRQAADDPIIRMSLAVREGRDLELGQYGESRVVSRREIATDDVTSADQVLVGTNRTRRLYNGRLRELKGLIDPLPAVGDKLVCLRNDKTKGLFNGGVWIVQRLKGADATKVKMDILPDEELARRSVSVSVLKAFFTGEAEAVPFAQRKRSDEFDYGYALTVHKAQGSQWDDVILFDESYAFREHRDRWLYTGLTRAAKRVTVVR
jgi:ATP-dependent exoDNAse (exonuclease V) alpha subunit